MTGRPLRRYSPQSNRRFPPFRLSAADGSVLTAVSLLAAIGLVAVYSITAPRAAAGQPSQFTRHIVSIVAGLILLVAVTRVPLALWKKLALPLWCASVLVLAATLIVGIEVNGARRWVGWHANRFQPAEVAKFATVLAAAAFFSEGHSRRARLRPLVGTAAICLPPVALLLGQPDFGSSLVICAVVGFQLFIAGAPIRQLGFGLLAGVLGTGAYIAMRPYALARWTGFLDPWATANREGFQLVQSFVAFGRGGNFGVPLGDGRQKLFYLPEAHTDFILSGIAEEAGLLGVLVVLAAFASFIAAGTRIAMRTRDSFATQMAFGMTALVGLPAAINAGVVMGLLPTTGFTLPFISYGANSMVMCAITVGLLLRISACEAAPQVVRISGAARRGSIS
ncbi:MAG: putative peptidoglycan glycosyltransferase FtsW [Myxococcota bacterium]